MDWLSPIRGIFEFAFPFLEHVPILEAIMGFLLVFFLLGFAWALVFLRQIKVIERVVLSCGLSIAIVTLSILFANNIVIGVRITGSNSVLVIVVVTILPVAIYYLNRFIRRRRGSATQD